MHLRAGGILHQAVVDFVGDQLAIPLVQAEHLLHQTLPIPQFSLILAALGGIGGDSRYRRHVTFSVAQRHSHKSNTSLSVSMGQETDSPPSDRDRARSAAGPPNTSRKVFPTTLPISRTDVPALCPIRR